MGIKTVKRVFASVRAIVNLAISEEGFDCSNAFAKTYFPNDENAQSRQLISAEDIRSWSWIWEWLSIRSLREVDE